MLHKQQQHESGHDFSNSQELSSPKETSSFLGFHFLKVVNPFSF